MASMDAKHKHLEMIQGVISRMSQNSFHLKGWSVVLVSALFALSAAEWNTHVIPLAYFPAIAFWLLDGYYLRQEKLYRKLYDHVRDLDESKIDYSMSVADFGKTVKPWACVMFSTTLAIFHGTIVATILFVMLIFPKSAT